MTLDPEPTPWSTGLIVAAISAALAAIAVFAFGIGEDVQDDASASPLVGPRRRCGVGETCRPTVGSSTAQSSESASAGSDCSSPPCSGQPSALRRRHRNMEWLLASGATGGAARRGGSSPSANNSNPQTMIPAGSRPDVSGVWL